MVLTLVIAALLLQSVPVFGDGAPPPGPGTPEASHRPLSTALVAEATANFIENRGQWNSDVRFVASSGFGHAVFGESGVTYDVVLDEVSGHRVRVSFSQGRRSAPEGVVDAGYPSHFLIGRDPSEWVTGVRSFAELLYRDVWPGIDIRYYMGQGALKYDVIVSDEADVGDVRFTLEGHTGLRIGSDRLEIGLTGGHWLQDGGLVARYVDGGAVDVRFDVDGDGFGFAVDATPGRAIVIDPVVVHASTLIGGALGDGAVDVEVDADGNVYVAGGSGSSDYPVTPGAYIEELQLTDAVVTKFNHNCSEVHWSTFMGGGSFDGVTGIDIDDEGHVYLHGITLSTDFPVTNGALQGLLNMGMNNNQPDLFVTKLGPNGDRLVYSTYVGGSGPDSPGNIEVRDGRAAVVGRTDSYDFPTEAGHYAANHGDALLFILNENGSRIVNTCFWGGSGSELATCLEFDANGDIVVGGYTSSMDFRVTPGAFQQVRPSFQSGFVSKYSPGKREILFSTYLGGSHDAVYTVAVDDELNIYAGGTSYWMGPPSAFPTTQGAFDRDYNGRIDSFVSKMSPTGTSLLYSTLLGGDGDDRIYDVEVDRFGDAVVVGTMTSGANFTVTEGCHDPTFSGTSEGFVFVLDPRGEAPVYSSFHGGLGEDTVTALCIDDRDNHVVAGSTTSKDFPLKEDAYQTRLRGGADTFVSIIGELSPPSAPRNLTALGGDGVIGLSWEPPMHDGNYSLREYLVYRGTSAGNLSLYAVLDGGVTATDDLDVGYGVDFFYAVIATNGKGAGPPSNIASARSFTVPDAPLNLTFVLDLDSVTLSWEAPSFNGGLPLREYRLYRSVHGGPTTLRKVIGPSVTTFEDSEVEDGTVYTYLLTSFNDFGKSKASATVTVRTHAAPSPPSAVHHTYGDLFVRLGWEAPEDDFGLPVAYYNIYRAEANEPRQLVGNASAVARALVDEDVEVGVAYVYTVTAVNAKGESAPSEEHDAMVMVRPWRPLGVAARAEVSAVRVTWSPPAYDGASPVLGYWVYHEVGPGEWANVGGVFVEGRDDVPLVFLHDAPYDGTARRYRVTAFNAEGESDPSEVAATKSYDVPFAPRDPHIEWGDGELTVDWQAPTEDGGTAIVSFTVYRRAAGEVGFVPVVTLGAHIRHYLDDTTPNGVEHTYRITARNLAGEGPPSTEVTATPAGRPGRPEAVSSVGLNRSALVKWQPPASTGGLPIIGYRLYGRSDGWLGELLAELGPDAREHVVTGLENAKVYLFAVTALSLAGESEASDIVEALPVGPPSEPIGLRAVWVEDHVLLTWSAPLLNGGAAITGFSLRRDDWDPRNWTEIGSLDMFFHDRSVVPGTTYNYTLRAHNDVGSGPDVTIAFTVPEAMEDPPRVRELDPWPVLALALGLVLVVAVAATLSARWRRERGP